MNFTTSEMGQACLNESLLNMSTGEQMKPRAHATSKLAKRKQMDSLI